jgi:flagellar biosynthetic protein FliR
MSNTPSQTKLGLSIFLSIILYNVLPEMEIEYASLLEYSAIVIKEAAVGLLIGFSAYICSSIILFAGRMIDTDIGLAMASMFDPTTQQMSTITGSLYNNLIMLLMLVSNMHVFLLSAMKDSFTLIPIGEVTVNGTLYETMIGFVTNYFIIGFRIALPIFVSVMVVDCVLGILTKVASQLNMFAVGIQIKIIVGFFVMYLTISLLPYVANFIYQNMKAAMKLIAGGLT